ncbi:MAG TPA: shikimate dehydrogenase [Candidatus Acidoferrales bacterium]|nr:shikimate dehydrogenase [Candidatus Acidoferrales bacterium]
MLGRFLGFNESPISGSTLVYGLIGDPVDHSLSPAMHNAAFRSLGLNAVYLAFRVRDGDLGQAVQGLKSLNVRGFNVTTPHKMGMLRYLDEVETKSAEIGSINTVKKEAALLTGFNTDGVGALRAMEEARIRSDERTVLLLGAGGAARAIAYTLARRGCLLNVANRSVSNARRLVRALNERFGVKTKSLPLSKRALKACVNQTEIILNASSMGMDGRHNPPIDKKWIRSDQCVFDIVYRPLRTKLLRDANAVEARTITGLDMLVNQGASSFTIWTGKKPPLREMRRAIFKLSHKDVASR